MNRITYQVPMNIKGEDLIKILEDVARDQGYQTRVEHQSNSEFDSVERRVMQRYGSTKISFVRGREGVLELINTEPCWEIIGLDKERMLPSWGPDFYVFPRDNVDYSDIEMYLQEVTERINSQE